MSKPSACETETPKDRHPGGGHAHAHAHGDHGHGHDHGHAHGADRRKLAIAFFLTAGFMVAEVAGGALSGSLALLADAGHMVTDAAALGMAWAAAALSERPADLRRTYGWRRLQVLSAFVNGVALLVVVAWILWEAIERMADPPEVAGGLMLAVAAAGLAVNLIVFRILHGGESASINVRGAALHVLGDLLGSVAALIAGMVILATGWTPIDPLLSVAVAALILRSAWKLTRESAHVLIEGAPSGLDPDEIGRALVVGVPEILEVHHVHVWALTPDRPLATLHARISADARPNAVLRQANALLRERFGVDHATIQIETADA